MGATPVSVATTADLPPIMDLPPLPSEIPDTKAPVVPKPAKSAADLAAATPPLPDMPALAPLDTPAPKPSAELELLEKNGKKVKKKAADIVPPLPELPAMDAAPSAAPSAKAAASIAFPRR